MNSGKGFTIIAVVWIAVLVALMGAGGYVLIKSTGDISEENAVITSESVSDSKNDSSNDSNSESLLQSGEEEEVAAQEKKPLSSAGVDTSPDSAEEDTTSEMSTGSESEPAQGTSSFGDDMLDNIYTGSDSETEPVSDPDPEPTPEPTPKPTPDPEPATPQTATVTYDNSGFSPVAVTIKQGGTVIFVNNSNHSMWVGSNSHPTHTGYPEKSLSDCLGSSFDSCVSIDPGSSWQFLFTSVGSWGYHNHTRVGKTGTVIVESL